MPPLLPRWLAAELQPAPPTTFFVTWRLRGTHLVLAPTERDLICAVLRHAHGERYLLKAYVVMDDHVHVLVQPMCLPIERVVQSWMSFTTHELQRLCRRQGALWQEDTALAPLATQEALRVCTEYIVGNPWKRWPFLKRYPWVWEAEVEGTDRRT